MANAVEKPQFIIQYLNSLGSRAVLFGADYEPSGPARNRGLIKKTVEHIFTLKSPVVEETPSSALINVTIKALKGNQSYKLTDIDQSKMTVGLLKESLEAQSKIPVEAQRLLLKGKVLVDSKLLKDYNITDGAVINLMAKTQESHPTTTVSTVVEPDTTLKTVEFWASLRDFLRRQLKKDEYADAVLEGFLESQRSLVGSLTIDNIKTANAQK